MSNWDEIDITTPDPEETEPNENEETEVSESEPEENEETETGDTEETENPSSLGSGLLGGSLGGGFGSGLTLGLGASPAALTSTGNDLGEENESGRLTWDGTGKRFYENGVDHGILFVSNGDGTYRNGIVWNGLTTVTESPDGAEPNDLWADNMKYATLYSNETFGATIEAYTYPDEFSECDGSYEPMPGVYYGQQDRKPFAFCYRTHVGNDTGLNAYKLHIVYNCKASPSEKSYETINDSPDAITFSWEVSTIPVPHGNIKPISTITIDESKLDERGLEIYYELLDKLYGSDNNPSTLPSTDEITDMFGAYEGNPIVFKATKPTPLSKAIVHIEPIQEGSGDPSPENIRAISGYDSISVTRTGKNMLPLDYVRRSDYTKPTATTSGNVITITDYDAGGRFVGFNVPTVVGQEYTVKYTARTNVTVVTVAEIDTEPSAWINSGQSVGPNAAYTYTATKAWAHVWIEISADNATVTDLQFEKGSTATAYEPYTGNATYTITFPESNPGTVYGGTLDVNTGELVVDRACVTFDGSTSSGWSSSTSTYGTSTRFDYTASQSILKVGGDVVSNYLSKGSIGTGGAECFNIHGAYGHILIQIHTDRLASADLSGLMGYFETHPLEFCYELAEPQTYHLTSQQMSILSLNGTNVISTNADTLEITYREDVGAAASSGYTKQQLLNLSDPLYVKNLVRIGTAEQVFDIGDQFNVTWNDGENTYDCPFDVVHFGKVINKHGQEVNAMYLQSHWALPGIQFDASEAIYYADEAMAAGTYYFTIGDNWKTGTGDGGFTKNDVYAFTLSSGVHAGTQFVVASSTNASTWGGESASSTPSNWKVYIYDPEEDEPTSVTISKGTPVGSATDLGTISITTKYSNTGLNNLQRASRGYARWSQSGARQWLNSDAAAGSWWTAQNNYDRPPEQLSTKRGFMAGLPANFLDMIDSFYSRTALNTVSDSDIGASETTLDKFALASIEQEYIVPHLAGTEGEAFQYWVDKLGTDQPQAIGNDGTNTEHIRQLISNHGSAQNIRLRSTYLSYSYNTYYVSSGGLVSDYNATAALGLCPICVVY